MSTDTKSAAKKRVRTTAMREKVRMKAWMKRIPSAGESSPEKLPEMQHVNR